MSKQMKQDFIRMILWSLVFVFFLAIFLSGDTLATWGDNTRKTIMVAALFLVGFGGDTILNVVYRKRKGVITKDERDDSIEKRAVSAGFVVTLIYVFILAISLYTKNESSGFVPVAWLWFLAYSLVCVANISVTAFSVFFYRKVGL